MAGSEDNRNLNALVSSLQAEAPSQEPIIDVESGTASEIQVRRTSKRRRYTTSYTDEDRAAIAKYAVEHGNAAAIKNFMPLFNLPESTVRSFKKRYLEELENIRKGGVEVSELTMVPAKKKGRKSKITLESITAPVVAGGSSMELGDQSLAGSMSVNDSVEVTVSSAPRTRSKGLQVAKPPMVLPPITQRPPSPSQSHSSDESSSDSPPPVKRARRSGSSKTNELLMKILAEVTNRDNEKPDEEALFGLQVAANMRRLTSKQKATAKIKIHQVLLEIEFPSET